MQFRYLYAPDRNEWVGVVTDDSGKPVNVACEATEAEIVGWFDTYVESGGEIEADMYDRSRRH